MVATAELRRLLSRVEFNARLNSTEGLTPFRNLLERDSDGSVRRFLVRELPKLQGERQASIAFALAEHYRSTGDLKSLQSLYAKADAAVKASVLNALWGSPGADPEMGPGIVELALDAATHAAPEVRTEACSVIQNQSAWKVDVSRAVSPLRDLLGDSSERVRMQAACAVGNLAKRKHDLSPHVDPLRRNLRHADLYVRNYSAWALWQMSRARHEIGAALEDLAQILTDDDAWNSPRKNAVGALLHHAKKSAKHFEQVKRRLKKLRLDPRQKESARLLEFLAAGG